MTRQLRVLLRRSSAASGGPLVKNEKRVKVSASSMAEVEAALAATFRSTVQGRPISMAMYTKPRRPAEIDSVELASRLDAVEAHLRQVSATTRPSKTPQTPGQQDLVAPPPTPPAASPAAEPSAEHEVSRNGAAAEDIENAGPPPVANGQKVGATEEQTAKERKAADKAAKQAASQQAEEEKAATEQRKADEKKAAEEAKRAAKQAAKDAKSASKAAAKQPVSSVPPSLHFAPPITARPVEPAAEPAEEATPPSAAQPVEPAAAPIEMPAAPALEGTMVTDETANPVSDDPGGREWAEL